MQNTIVGKRPLATAIERLAQAVDRLTNATDATRVAAEAARVAKSNEDDTEKCERCGVTARMVADQYRCMGLTAMICPRAASQTSVGHEWPSDRDARSLDDAIEGASDGGWR